MKIINGFGKGALPEYVYFVEKNMGIKFPPSYVACIRDVDSGTPEKPLFTYKDPERKRSIVDSASFISFNPERNDNILRSYFLKPESFPNHLVAVMENGGGNYVCFDYSIDGFSDLDPPVVFWIHDNTEGNNIADLAINFETFLYKLKSEDEIDFEIP